LTRSVAGAKMREEEEPVGDTDELLRLEYESASRLLGSLTEIRFKLLALVPSLTGAVVALMSPGRSGVEILAIGGLGLAATSGLLAYELRNGELCRRATERVGRLESVLFSGGPLVGEGRNPKLFGVIPASHHLGVGLVYGAALGGWVYLVVWGALVAAGAHAHSQAIGVAVGAVAALAIVREVVVAQRTEPKPAAAIAPREA
jgi:hypothetical protein